MLSGISDSLSTVLDNAVGRGAKSCSLVWKDASEVVSLIETLGMAVDNGRGGCAS